MDNNELGTNLAEVGTDVPDINVGDMISRQAAIDAVQNRHMMLSKEKVLLINDLEKLPPAEPKRITGHWIFDNQYLFAWKCSVCGRNPTRGMGIVQGHDELYKYCPHCGAKMEKEVTE